QYEVVLDQRYEIAAQGAIHLRATLDTFYMAPLLLKKTQQQATQPGVIVNNEDFFLNVSHNCGFPRWNAVTLRYCHGFATAQVVTTCFLPSARNYLQTHGKSRHHGDGGLRPRRNSID